MAKPYYTLQYQFRLADNALHEARHLLRAKYYTSCISQCFQVAHRCAAGLLFGIEARVHTEADVGFGFESAFVSSGKSEARFRDAYRRLAELRRKADYEYEYLATPEEAQEALRLAESFYEESQRLRADLPTGTD